MHHFLHRLLHLFPFSSTSGWLLPVPFCRLFLHDRERQTATLFFLSHSVHLPRTDLTQQSIRLVYPPTVLLSSLSSSINLSVSTVRSNKRCSKPAEVGFNLHTTAATDKLFCCQIKSLARCLLKNVAALALSKLGFD